MAALIAWMLVVRVGDLVKDGAISAVTRVFDALRRRRLRRSTILDKITNANRVLSKRSRPLSGPRDTSQGQLSRTERPMTAELPHYEILAVRYGTSTARPASQNFIMSDGHDGPMPMD